MQKASMPIAQYSAYDNLSDTDIFLILNSLFYEYECILQNFYQNLNLFYMLIISILVLASLK
jgi:hypothetical protein